MFKTQERVRSTKQKTWPGPAAGWYANGVLTAPENSAAQLDNFFPTLEGCRLRAGLNNVATADGTPVRLITYQSGTASALFVTTATSVIDITSPAAPDEAETATIGNLTSGDWSHVQFATAGGEFMVMVNGADRALYYDGTDMNPIADEAVNNLAYDAQTGAFTPGLTVTGGTSGATAKILAVAPTLATTGTLKVGVITGTFQDNETITDSGTGSATSNIPAGTSSASAVTITGIATTSLSHVWQYKERLFFCEKDKLSFWYLPVESIGGAASEFPLGSVFKYGGKLLFGGTWSLDSGTGLDDKCIFVTDQGEVAVYEGTNPGDASYWGLVGVYYIGKPLNKHCIVQYGGETHIMTEDGIVPLSSAIVRGHALEDALTYPIHDAWQESIARQTVTYPMTVTAWPSRGMLIVGTPVTVTDGEVAFVMNLRTGAWCRYVNWDVRCSVVYGDNLYIGSDTDARIFQAEVNGNDNASNYTGYYVGKFSDCADYGTKHANHLNLLAKGQDTFDFSAKAVSNHEIGTLTAPSAMATPAGSTKTGYSRWKSVAASGHVIAPVVMAASNQANPPDFEINATQLRFETGNPM